MQFLMKIALSAERNILRVEQVARMAIHLFVQEEISLRR